MSKDLDIKIEKVVTWLQEKVKESHTNGLVVGISGGIDSALVSFLIKKAFPNNSLGVILPINSNPDDEKDALEVAKKCDIKNITLDLSDIKMNLLDTVTKALNSSSLFNQDNLKLTDANLRARLRMSTIYSVANNLNYLVVGTDNKAEVHTGYFTKYGDGGVDILPIANLSKREVYEWSKYLGVPSSVLERQPSAGLWEGQTDENEMGTTYNMIDDYLNGKEIPKKDKDIIDNLHKRSMHKRKMPDACEI